MIAFSICILGRLRARVSARADRSDPPVYGGGGGISEERMSEGDCQFYWIRRLDINERMRKGERGVGSELRSDGGGLEF